MAVPASNCIFRLIKTGLVLIDSGEKPEHFVIVRPASLAGTEFPGIKPNGVGSGGAWLLTNAPTASLRQLVEDGQEWEIDISLKAAPGPGPIWFRERFMDVENAVEAIRECYFGNRINFASETLWGHYRRSGGT